MKMRKIISFVLVLALVLGSFSMAFAATPSGLSDIAGHANEEAIQVNNDLGIITGYADGTFLPEKAVTRAEFAAMITRAMAIPASALAGYSATSFKDMAGATWAAGYVGFSASKGILLGDGAGNVMPSRTINVNEAMTMVLRAIGYVNHSAELVGTWPSNYVTVAQNAGLYDDVAATMTVDRASAAQIIYNILTVQKVAVNSDGQTTGLTQDDPNSTDSAITIASTLLNTGLNCMSNEEVVEYTADSLINLNQYIGANANVYRNSGGDGDIVAVEVLSVFLTGDYNWVDGVFEATDKDYTISEDLAINSGQNTYVGDVPVFENARFDHNCDLDSHDTDVTIAVKVSGKKITALYSIGEWYVDDAVVAAIGDIEDLDEQQFAGWDFTTDDNGDIDANSFVLVGATSVDKIAKDDVVYIYTDDDDMITKIAVGTAVIEDQKVTEQDGDDYTIGGTVYNVASYIGDWDVEDFAVGNTVNATLDAYGDIFTLEIVVGTPDMYGVVTAYAEADFDDARVKLYTIDEATKTFTIDGDEVMTELTEDSLIGYGLDADGLIDSVETDTITAAAVTLSSVSVLKADTTTYAISSDVVVFTYDGEDYAVMDIADVETGVDVAGDDFQMIVEDARIVAMVIDADAAGTATDGNYAVINTEVVAIDDDDNTIEKLTGFMDGAAFTKYSDDDDVVAFDNDDIALWDLELDSAGIITGATTAAVSAVYMDQIGDLNADKTAVYVGGVWYALASNAVVYVVEDVDGDYEYDLSSVASLRDEYHITLFEIDDDFDGYDVVVFEKEPVF